METMVEIYEVEPQIMTEVTPEEHELVKAQIERLGLTQQQNLYVANTGTIERIPYMSMNRGMKHIIETLCKKSDWLYDYGHEIIPPRVLQEIERAKQWFPGDMDMAIRYAGEKPDPFLIARKGGMSYSWNMPYDGGDNYFVIARWGEEAASWDELRERAYKKYVDDRRNELERQRITAEFELKTLEMDAHRLFS